MLLTLTLPLRSHCDFAVVLSAVVDLPLLCNADAFDYLSGEVRRLQQRGEDRIRELNATLRDSPALTAEYL